MANHPCALYFPFAACLEASRLLPTPGREAGPDVSGSGKPVSGFGEPPPHQAASIKRSCARSGILTAGIKSISVYLRQDVLGLCASELSSRLCLLRLRGFFFLFFSFLFWSPLMAVVVRLFGPLHIGALTILPAACSSTGCRAQAPHLCLRAFFDLQSLLARNTKG